jgi:hypothetical protein
VQAWLDDSTDLIKSSNYFTVLTLDITENRLIFAGTIKFLVGGQKISAAELTSK